MTHFRARASLLPTQTLQSALDFFSPKALEGEMQRRGREGGRSGGLTSLTIAGAARVAPCHGVCTMSSTGFVRLPQSSVMRSLIFSRIPVSKLPIEAHLYHISKPRRLKRLCLELGRDESTRARNFGEIRYVSSACNGGNPTLSNQLSHNAQAPAVRKLPRRKQKFRSETPLTSKNYHPNRS